MERLRQKIKNLGHKHPKKHGEWFRLPVYGDHVLILDTWNNQIYHHRGGEPHDLSNMYRVVYTFSGRVGRVTSWMANFWSAHIPSPELINCKN